MQRKKETSPFSWKLFLLFFALFFMFYNGFYLLTIIIDKKPIENISLTTWIINGGLMPGVLSLSLAYILRVTSLIIINYNAVPDFRVKLLKHLINQKGIRIETQTEHEIHFKPTAWYNKIVRSWLGTEDLHVIWRDQEVLIKGSARRVSIIEDILTWNQDFKPSQQHQPQ